MGNPLFSNEPGEYDNIVYTHVLPRDCLKPDNPEKVDIMKQIAIRTKSLGYCLKLFNDVCESYRFSHRLHKLDREIDLLRQHLRAWYESGDSMSPEKFIYVNLTDLIGGETINSEQIENAFVSHPRYDELCCIVKRGDVSFNDIVRDVCLEVEYQHNHPELKTAVGKAILKVIENHR